VKTRKKTNDGQSLLLFRREYDELKGRYSEIKIDTASDNLISVIIKNGKIIDYDDDGATLHAFDDEEQSARKARSKVLNG